MKCVIVTGGAGFIGAHLCRALLRRGDRVLCVDNFSSGTPGAVSDLESHSRFTLLEHDICRPLEASADEIYNLACPASPTYYQNDPLQTMKTNVLGSMNMLELARSGGMKILQASTSEVYGDPLQTPQSESYWGHVNPLGPRSCYNEGKRSAESLFMDYRRLYGLPVRIVRIFNSYGPGMLPDDGRVITNLIIQSLNKQEMTVYGRGDQTRSFCYVDDLVEGLMAFMDLDSDIPGPLNLGRAEEISILELARLIRRLGGGRSDIVFRELPPDDPCRRQPDLSSARELIQWNPRITLEEGLKKTIAHLNSIQFTQ